MLHIGGRYNRSCASLSVSGNAVPFVNKAKYLGIYIPCIEFKLSYSEPRSKFCRYLVDCCIKVDISKITLLLNLINSFCKP